MIRKLTAVIRGQFAVLTLQWDYYPVVSSINLHDTYLNTQLGTIYIVMNVIEIDKG